MKRQFPSNFPIIGSDSRATDQFRTWGLSVDQNLPIFGEGSPEGVVPQPEIGGDIRLGWELA